MKALICLALAPMLFGCGTSEQPFDISSIQPAPQDGDCAKFAAQSANATALEGLGDDDAQRRIFAQAYSDCAKWKTDLAWKGDPSQ
jgi:hypothetical protein